MSGKQMVTRVSAYTVCTDAAGRVLLCRLSERVIGYAGWWTLPGGGLDHGEDPRGGAMRELEEETGLEAELDALLDVNSFRHTTESRDFWGIRILYRARVTGGDLRDEADGTTDRCAWLSLEEIAAERCVDLVHVALEHLEREAGRSA